MAKDIMTSGIEMSDVIKTTGFPVPEDMEGKTFEECVSGGIVAEPLAVTENGVYTAPSGKAYSPVTVNVPSGGATDLIFNVKCVSLTDDYFLAITFPRSNKVTDINVHWITYSGHTFDEHYNFNENGYVVVELASQANTKVSVVYDGDTYSYTYTGRDYEQHDLIKE